MSDFIERARALDKAATEGPWVLIDEEEANESPVARSVQPGITYDADKYDAEFIAAARSMLPAAVEALARVRELHGRFSLRRVATLSRAKPPEDIGQTQWCAFCEVEWPCATYEATEVES